MNATLAACSSLVPKSLQPMYHRSVRLAKKKKCGSFFAFAYLNIAFLSHAQRQLRHVFHDVVQVVVEAGAQAQTLVTVVQSDRYLGVLRRAAYLQSVRQARVKIKEDHQQTHDFLL